MTEITSKKLQNISKILLFLVIIFISENLVSQNKELLTDNSELIKDLKGFEKFVHRTFQPTDALYFIHFFNK